MPLYLTVSTHLLKCVGLCIHCWITAGRKACAVHSAFLPQGRGRSSHLLSVRSNLVSQGLRQRTYLTSKLPPWWGFVTALFLCTLSPSFLSPSTCHCAAGFFFFFLAVIHQPASTQISLPSAEQNQYVCRIPHSPPAASVPTEH